MRRTVCSSRSCQRRIDDTKPLQTRDQRQPGKALESILVREIRMWDAKGIVAQATHEREKHFTTSERFQRRRVGTEGPHVDGMGRWLSGSSRRL